MTGRVTSDGSRDGAAPTDAGGTESIHEALQRQLQRLDASFKAPGRQRRSSFHQMAIPPQKEVEVSLPRSPLHRTAPASSAPAEAAAAPAAAPSRATAADDRWAALPEDEDALAWSPLPEEERGAAWRARWPGLMASAPAMALAALVVLAGGSGLFLGSQLANLGAHAPDGDARVAFTARPVNDDAARPAEPPPVEAKATYDRVDPLAPLPAAGPAGDGAAAPPALRRDMLPPDADAPAAIAAIGDPAVTAPVPELPAALPEPEPAPAVEVLPAAPRPAAAAPAAPKADQPRIASAAPTGTGRIVKDVNMRSAPENSGAVIMIVRAGSQVDVYGCKFWCEVGVAGKRGYVYRDFVR